MERCDRRICNEITKELTKLYTRARSLSNNPEILRQDYTTEEELDKMVSYELESVNRKIARKEKQLLGLEDRDKRIRKRTKRQANPKVEEVRKLRQISYACTGKKRQKDIPAFKNTPPYVKDLFIIEKPEMEEVEY